MNYNRPSGKIYGGFMKIPKQKPDDALAKSNVDIYNGNSKLTIQCDLKARCNVSSLNMLHIFVRKMKDKQ